MTKSCDSKNVKKGTKKGSRCGSTESRTKSKQTESCSKWDLV